MIDCVYNTTLKAPYTKDKVNWGVPGHTKEDIAHVELTWPVRVINFFNILAFLCILLTPPPTMPAPGSNTTLHKAMVDSWVYTGTPHFKEILAEIFTCTAFI